MPVVGSLKTLLPPLQRVHGQLKYPKGILKGLGEHWKEVIGPTIPVATGRAYHAIMDPAPQVQVRQGGGAVSIGDAALLGLPSDQPERGLIAMFIAEYRSSVAQRRTERQMQRVRREEEKVARRTRSSALRQMASKVVNPGGLKLGPNWLPGPVLRVVAAAHGGQRWLSQRVSRTAGQVRGTPRVRFHEPTPRLGRGESRAVRREVRAFVHGESVVLSQARFQIDWAERSVSKAAERVEWKIREGRISGEAVGQARENVAAMREELALKRARLETLNLKVSPFQRYRAETELGQFIEETKTLRRTAAETEPKQYKKGGRRETPRGTKVDESKFESVEAMGQGEAIGEGSASATRSLHEQAMREHATFGEMFESFLAGEMKKWEIPERIQEIEDAIGNITRQIGWMKRRQSSLPREYVEKARENFRVLRQMQAEMRQGFEQYEGDTMAQRLEDAEDIRATIGGRGYRQAQAEALQKIKRNEIAVRGKR